MISPFLQEPLDLLSLQAIRVLLFSYCLKSRLGVLIGYAPLCQVSHDPQAASVLKMVADIVLRISAVVKISCFLQFMDGIIDHPRRVPGFREFFPEALYRIISGPQEISASLHTGNAE